MKKFNVYLYLIVFFISSEALTNENKVVGKEDLFVHYVYKKQTAFKDKNNSLVDIPFASICYKNEYKKQDESSSVRQNHLCAIANKKNCELFAEKVAGSTTLGSLNYLSAVSLFSNSHIPQGLDGQFKDSSMTDSYRIYLMEANSLLKSGNDFFVTSTELTTKFRYEKLDADSAKKEFDLILPKFFDACQKIVNLDLKTLYFTKLSSLEALADKKQTDAVRLDLKKGTEETKSTNIVPRKSPR